VNAAARRCAHESVGERAVEEVARAAVRHRHGVDELASRAGHAFLVAYFLDRSPIEQLLDLEREIERWQHNPELNTWIERDALRILRAELERRRT